MNINWQEMEKLLDQALAETVIEISEKNTIADELNQAWNRGAEAMKSSVLVRFIRKEREEEK